MRAMEKPLISPGTRRRWQRTRGSRVVAASVAAVGVVGGATALAVTSPPSAASSKATTSISDDLSSVGSPTSTATTSSPRHHQEEARISHDPARGALLQLLAPTSAVHLDPRQLTMTEVRQRLSYEAPARRPRPARSSGAFGLVAAATVLALWRAVGRPAGSGPSDGSPPRLPRPRPIAVADDDVPAWVNSAVPADLPSASSQKRADLPGERLSWSRRHGGCAP